MMSTPPLPPSSDASEPLASGYLAWDDTPSMADSLNWRMQLPVGRRAALPIFPETRPADLATPVEPTPFKEPVKGLAMRELVDDDLFVHLFGPFDPA